MRYASKLMFALALSLLMVSPAKALVMTFYGDSFSTYDHFDANSSFLSNLTSPYYESFENVQSSDVMFGNGVTADLSFGRRQTGSDGSLDGNYVWQTVGSRNLVVDFQDSPVSGFGVFITDLDYGADLYALINDVSYNIPNPLEPRTHQGETSFWGFIDTESTFDKITFSGLTTYIDWELMTIGTPVNSAPGPVPTPEPSTLLLLGAGLVGVIAFRRRKA